MRREPRKLYEEYAYVLDFIPHGRGYRAVPTALLLGERYFTFLEAAIRPGVALEIGERVYVGREREREKVDHIKGRINCSSLTPVARSELPTVIGKIVKQNERRFLDFFNRASAITPRMHALELIPGIGKRYTREILRERGRGAFESFEDIRKRVNMPDPVKLITKRILEELTDAEVRYRLFTRVP